MEACSGMRNDGVVSWRHIIFLACCYNELTQDFTDIEIHESSGTNTYGTLIT
jgi:hypothetical protein